MSAAAYCCPMRARFIVCVAGENTEAPDPVDAVDFIDFNVKLPSGLPVMCIKFCPFCGKEIPRDETLRVVS